MKGTLRKWWVAFWNGLWAALKWIIRIFEDTSGIPSSKRITAILLYVVSFYLAFEKYPIEYVIAFLSAATTLQGVTMVGGKISRAASGGPNSVALDQYRGGHE